MYLTKAYAAKSATQPLGPFQIARREVGPHDVLINIDYCGVCHTDLHFVRNEWQSSIYPMVPGHEIVDRVNKVGAHVTKFEKDDLVAVGCMVDSCQHCDACGEGMEQYCQNTPTFTYNDKDRLTGELTYGGYSVKYRFVIDLASLK
jgi:uncharacterized zinc-type alcohol dehydrogenase-like protein